MVARSKMRLFVLGATGGTGRSLVEQALWRGHSVTAFVRSPGKLAGPRQGLTVLKGDPRDADQLRAVLSGHDAVVSALGPPGPGRTSILRDCARSTVAAMQETQVRRLLVVSAAVLFPDAGLLATVLRHTFLRSVAKDSLEMERIVVASGLDWTIVRPPRLTHGPLTTHYSLADGHLPQGRLVVSRADVAHFLLAELEQNGHRGQIVGMASVPARAARLPRLSRGPAAPTSKAKYEETHAP